MINSNIKMKIGIIEDNEELTRNYKVNLQKGELAVDDKDIESRTNKSEGIKMIRYFNPKIVILDLKIPEDPDDEDNTHPDDYRSTTGLSILEDVSLINSRRSSKNQIKVIVVSGSVEDPSAKYLLDFLEKVDVLKFIEKGTPHTISNIKSSVRYFQENINEGEGASLNLEDYYLDELSELSNLDNEIFVLFKGVIEPNLGNTIVLNRCFEILKKVMNHKFRCNFDDLKYDSLVRKYPDLNIKNKEGEVPNFCKIHKLAGIKTFLFSKKNQSFTNQKFENYFTSDSIKSDFMNEQPYISKITLRFCDLLLDYRNNFAHDPNDEGRRLNIEQKLKHPKLTVNGYKSIDLDTLPNSPIIFISIAYQLLLDYQIFLIEKSN